ncbi:MAG: transcriptional regulator [Methanomassiliicoccales archaeon]
MQRDELVEGIRHILAKAGFYVSKPINMKSISFDIVARRDQLLLIIKVLTNVDAFSKDNAEEIKVLAEALQAAPILIGEKSGSRDIEAGIVYSRFGVPIISPETLSDYLLEGVPPFIFAAPGGLYVRLDSDLLRSIREKKNISLGTLAEVAGVSRRTIKMYESGMGAMIDVALRLEEYLGEFLVMPLDPFKYTPDTSERLTNLSDMDDLSREVFALLGRLGYSVLPTARCPFEALTKDNRTLIITGVGKDETKLVEKACIVGDISKITERKSVIFLRHSRSKQNIGGAAIIGKDELKKLDESQELFEMVIARCGAHEKH